MGAGQGQVRVHRLVVGGEPLFVLSVPVERSAEELTRAESAIARRVLAGASNAEIARARRTSARTVANQLASIYRKLGIASRTEFVAKLRGA